MQGARAALNLGFQGGNDVVAVVRISPVTGGWAAKPWTALCTASQVDWVRSSNAVFISAVFWPTRQLS